MKKLIMLVVAFLLITSNVYSAELLINNREGHKGDIICVRPDGFNWSDSEKPRVIKLKDVKYEDAQKYETSYYQDKEVIIDGKTEIRPEMIYERRYKVPDTFFTGSKFKDNVKDMPVINIQLSIVDKTK